MSNKSFLIMQTGDSPEYISSRHKNIDSMFLRMADYTGLEVSVIHLDKGEIPKNPDFYSGIIIAGSHTIFTDKLPWYNEMSKWIKRAVEKNCRILGICHGHYLLASSLGGKITNNPNGLELGTHIISINSKANSYSILAYLTKKFPGNLCHAQTITKLPKDAVVLAKSKLDSHQILAYSENIFSVQFHPEFDQEVIESCIRLETFSPDSPLYPKREKLLADASDTPVAKSILRLFVRQSAEELS